MEQVKTRVHDPEELDRPSLLRCGRPRQPRDDQLEEPGPWSRSVDQRPGDIQREPGKEEGSGYGRRKAQARAHCPHDSRGSQGKGTNLRKFRESLGNPKEKKNLKIKNVVEPSWLTTE